MSFFKKSSKQDASRPNSVRSYKKENITGFVMKFEERPKLDKSSSFIRKSTTRLRKENSSPVLRPTVPTIPKTYDVAIIGAGPAGLALASNLIRFGVNVLIIDNRSDRTITGRADSLQPKTIETLRQMRLSDRLLLKGVKVHDMRFWASSHEKPLSRLRREVHFPCDQVDTIDPYLLNVHQGFVEDVFLRDMMERGCDVVRNTTFVDYTTRPGNWPIHVVCESNATQEQLAYHARYLVGCDGAQSMVAKAMGARQIGGISGEVWGVIDGVLDTMTDFPDIYSTTVVHSKDGAAMLMPRERNMTRLYVELKSGSDEGASSTDLSQDYAMQRAAEIFEPYNLKWKSLDWYGRYQIGRRTATKFVDDLAYSKVFLCGDAAHSNSPISHGMNTSIQDSWNLAWKFNLAIRGLSKPALLSTYEDERRQVADNFLDFDHEQMQALLAGDAMEFAEISRRNARLVSGFGADYAPNMINVAQKGSMRGLLRVGSLPPPAKVTRFIDATPVDLQIDIPTLGQFRIFFFAKNLSQSLDFLEAVSAHALTGASVLGRASRAASASYSSQPPLAAISDDFIRPERYTSVSGLFTFAIVLQAKLEELEIRDLPSLWKESKFTVYLDDVPHMDTFGMTCTEKWLGGCTGSEVDIVVIRPDGVVGTMYRGRATVEHATRACQHLDAYFEAFLDV